MKKKTSEKKARSAPKPKGRDDILTEVIKEVAGQDVLPLVKALKNKKNISEFKLADAIRQEINLTRNMLYRLYDQNLVSFIRKKDKKKGWYIYYWTFNPKRIKELVRNLKKTRVERLKERLEREKSTNFFTCANKCIRLDFDQATEFEYKCPECGEILQQEDNTPRIKELEKELQKLEKELKLKA
jgi:transcription initiation factor TFIIE subunit alpha